MAAMTHKEFISESIRPVPGTADAAAMARGEPGLPARFLWRDREVAVADVLERRKETSGCRNGSPEQYVRKHWFRIRTADGDVWTLYFERQARSRRDRTRRWWLHTVERPENRDR